jgi:hypothetical protein
MIEVYFFLEIICKLAFFPVKCKVAYLEWSK